MTTIKIEHPEQKVPLKVIDKQFNAHWFSSRLFISNQRYVDVYSILCRYAPSTDSLVLLRMGAVNQISKLMFIFFIIKCFYIIVLIIVIMKKTNTKTEIYKQEYINLADRGITYRDPFSIGQKVLWRILLFCFYIYW